MRERIEPGLMVFTADGEVGVGAVREVLLDTSQIVINIENAGDFIVSTSAVRDVHSGKLILDLEALGEDLREAVRHAHDAEDPDYEASSIEDVLPDGELPPEGAPGN